MDISSLLIPALLVQGRVYAKIEYPCESILMHAKQNRCMNAHSIPSYLIVSTSRTRLN